MTGTITRSMSEVVQDIAGNVREIVRSEARLAGAEMRQEASKAGRAGGVLGAAAAFAFYCLGFLLLTLMLRLSMTMAAWQAALIVAAVAAVPAWLLMRLGRSRLKGVKHRPERAIGNMKENVQWLRHRNR